jgi:hypothetical protein
MAFLMAFPPVVQEYWGYWENRTISRNRPSLFSNAYSIASSYRGSPYLNAGIIPTLWLWRWFSISFPYSNVHFSRGENPPIALYYLFILAGPLNFPIHGPIPNGMRITVESAKNRVRNGVTSSMPFGPPRFIMRTAVLWSLLKLDCSKYGSEEGYVALLRDENADLLRYLTNINRYINRYINI